MEVRDDGRHPQRSPDDGLGPAVQRRAVWLLPGTERSHRCAVVEGKSRQSDRQWPDDLWGGRHAVCGHHLRTLPLDLCAPRLTQPCPGSPERFGDADTLQQRINMRTPYTVIAIAWLSLSPLSAQPRLTLDWEAMAERVVAQLAPEPGEKILLVARPGNFDDLIPPSSLRAVESGCRRPWGDRCDRGAVPAAVGPAGPSTGGERGAGGLSNDAPRFRRSHHEIIRLSVPSALLSGRSTSLNVGARSGRTA